MTSDLNRPLSILLVDDHEMLRVGLRALLEEQPEFTVAGEAGTVAEGLNKIENLHPDIVLLDIDLPDGNGLDACRSIRTAGRQEVKILVFSGTRTKGILAEAIAAGAQGFLLKGSSADEVLQAVRDVAEGKHALDPALTGEVFASLRAISTADPMVKWESLSKQERRVIEKVASGLTNKEIGVALKLSDKTVKDYLSNALDKLGLHRRAEAAAFYARHRN
jgi:DNA-binding NarL/FixJ family response regulator